MALVDETCLRLLEGQWLDISFESGWTSASREYIDMISLKTGALLGCAAELGALLAFDDDSRRPPSSASGATSGSRSRFATTRSASGATATRRASRRAATFGARRSHFPSSAPFKTRHRRPKSCGGSTRSRRSTKSKSPSSSTCWTRSAFARRREERAEGYRDRALAEIATAPAVGRTRAATWQELAHFLVDRSH